MMDKQYRINVYNDEMSNEVIARVRYNSNLDYWDGHNWSNGGVGRHKGLTKLKNGQYVLINGSNWQGDFSGLGSPCFWLAFFQWILDNTIPGWAISIR